MLTKILNFFVQREGTKFLKLNEEVNERNLVPVQAKEFSEASLYIHIPFCKTLCPYCSFNRYRFEEEKARIYFKNLKKELDLYIQRGYRFSNFYFGGGTPTILMDELIGFIDILKENFEVEEISVETTPHRINEENINLLKDAGVSRLSIGVQSFDEGIVKAIGRIFIAKDVKEKIMLVKDKFETINLDFIFNFPTQSIDQVKADLEIFRSLEVNQVTFYPLMPSPHKRAAIERRFNRIDTSREKEFYDVITNTLFDESYSASTVWCFSKGDRVIDEYIIDFDDYIGLGCGSVSLLKGNFYVNSFSLDRYGELLAKNKLPIIRCKSLNRNEQVRYYFLTKLFGMKLDTKLFYQKFNVNIHTKLWKEVMFLKFFGLIREKNGIITVTKKGMYQVNMLMREFYGSLNGLREYCIENQI
ncbi:MAG: coproporphyrinogen III oxidase family protein [Candidatus Hodarchaeota archaeon]